MEQYTVPFGMGQDELTEKRSRFIGCVWRVDSEEEARRRIEETRKKHYDARHNCWCYLLRESGTVRYSDDGEPQGTAGQPMLNVFLREGVTNVCCVVTRYFGGILLGAGGLTRAYSTAAKLALASAGISRMRLWSTLAVGCDYGMYQRILQLVRQCGGQVEDTDFGIDVVLTVVLPSESAARFAAELTELTAGTVEPLLVEERFYAGPREESRGAIQDPMDDLHR